MLITLPKIEDPRGNLTFIEHAPRQNCPFPIGAVGWVYDLPADSEPFDIIPAEEPRMIVAMNGGFEAAVHHVDSAVMRRCDRALTIDAGARSTVAELTTNAVAMILTGGKETAEDPIENSHQASDVAACGIVSLSRKPFRNGSVTEIQNGDGTLPFDIRRVFYLYDVPADSERGGHSHYQARELIVALSGSFDVVLDDGKHEPQRFTLNRPYRGLYITAGMWRTLDNFSGGSVCMVLTSQHYSEADYVREYDEFKSLANGRKV